MIKKVFNFLNTFLGMPYYLFLNTLKGAYKGLKGFLKGFKKAVQSQDGYKYSLL